MTELSRNQEQDVLTEEYKTNEELIEDNQLLLDELELAYKNMEMILEQSSREKEIAYHELQRKFKALESLYTELSNKENMLIHMEKLSSIGQFITEIIHELSNPLTVISGTVQLAQLMDLPENINDQFHIISQNVDRMYNCLIRFKDMAHNGKENFCLFDINENLKDTLKTIDILKPKRIKLDISHSTEPLIVKGDPFQLTQIYLNLAKNAFDAMEKKGKVLSFATRLVTVDWIMNSEEFGETYCQDRKTWENILKNSGRFALVEVADQGTGIRDKNLDNIFTAFFTTKERGKGTGLGLSISSDIAKRHMGNLAVKSKLNEGTVFQLLVPVDEESS